MKVWITGASSGIGRGTALAFAAKGDALLLTSRNLAALEQVRTLCLEAGAARVELLPADLAQTSGIEALVGEAWELMGGIDTVFCNAGISQRTQVLDTDESMIRRIMELNYFAPVLMAKALLPRMLAAGGGRIAVTSSINGRFGFPLRCGYSSSKHALYGFFETLRAEYRRQGILVTIICPGRVQTDISLHALDKGGREHGSMDAGQAGGMDAVKAGRIIERAIRKGRREKLVGGKELLMVYIKRFFPGLCAWLAARIDPM